MADFVLFGTEGCHLCEEAEQQLLLAGLVFEKLDIIENEHYLQRYAIRIPVLLHAASELELGWPFSINQLNEFIGKTQIRAYQK